MSHNWQSTCINSTGPPLCMFSLFSPSFELLYYCATAKLGILFWCSLSRLQVGRKTGRRRKKSYWFESQSWHCLIAWLQVNGRSLIKNVILIAELSYLLKKRGLYQQQECSYHLERLELAYELPFLFKKKKKNLSISVFTILLVMHLTANSRN